MNDGRYEWTGDTFFIKEDDERFVQFKEIKKKTGISPDETWSLYNNIALFILPRLKLFKEKQSTIDGHPGCFRSKKAWHKILDKMIWSFEMIAREDEDSDFPPKDWTKSNDEYYREVQKGINLFAKYFQCLWW